MFDHSGVRIEVPGHHVAERRLRRLEAQLSHGGLVQQNWRWCVSELSAVVTGPGRVRKAARHRLDPIDLKEPEIDGRIVEHRLVVTGEGHVIAEVERDGAIGDEQAARWTPGTTRTASRRALVQGEANSITTPSLLVWVASLSAKAVWR